MESTGEHQRALECVGESWSAPESTGKLECAGKRWGAPESTAVRRRAPESARGETTTVMTEFLSDLARADRRELPKNFIRFAFLLFFFLVSVSVEK